MTVIGVIPARWGSTRFEGKVLATIAGKPMIQHVFERVKMCRSVDQILIACDDARVLKAAMGFGAQAIMTSAHHASGTDRIAEAVQKIKADIVVNIQGDEPLIDPKVIDDLVKALQSDSSCSMATVIKPIENKEDLNNPHVVKVVIDKDQNALYFSRSPIPYNRDGQDIRFYKHLGIYAYRRDFLLTLTKLSKSFLEEAEQLEQLRALEGGYKIKTITTDTETIAVDTKEDIKKVEAFLANHSLQ